ncbi:hypothetical protein BaRGS_00016147 [Batillaria attramentaria]|uniref:Uncharacterized protein n=1 Tax=Batillaria attramentaria TaxID=370345 RepID=A0ABD0KZI9_9CAEN
MPPPKTPGVAAGGPSSAGSGAPLQEVEHVRKMFPETWLWTKTTVTGDTIISSQTHSIRWRGSFTGGRARAQRVPRDVAVDQHLSDVCGGTMTPGVVEGLVVVAYVVLLKRCFRRSPIDIFALCPAINLLPRYVEAKGRGVSVSTDMVTVTTTLQTVPLFQIYADRPRPRPRPLPDVMGRWNPIPMMAMSFNRPPPQPTEILSLVPQLDLQEVEQVRNVFPETWLWRNASVGYLNLHVAWLCSVEEFWFWF